MTERETAVPWLQWLAIAVLLIAGIVGLGLSLCGGFFLFASLTESDMGGVLGLAAVSLAVGLGVLFVSLRQIRAIARQPVEGVRAPLPRALKRAAWLAVADFLVTGLWFFLPLIVSLLRRRRWARPLIAAVIGLRWLSTIGLMFRPYGGWSSVIYYGLVVVGLDVATLVTLFSGAVSAWFNESRPRGGAA